MKKILYLVSTLKRSGPTNQLSYIIKYLDRSKYSPFVLTLSPEPVDSLKSFFTDSLGVEVHTLGLSRIKGLFFAKSTIKEFIQTNSIDLIHSQGIRADSLVSKMNVPRVSTLRNYPFYDYPMTYGRLLGGVMARMHLNYLKGIDCPVVVSKSVSHMLSSINNYKIAYVQNGVDLERFPQQCKLKIRSKLDISSDAKVFISVGHLSGRKDPFTIIKAFKLANIKNSILIFLGDGELFDSCNSMVNDSQIILAGKVNNVIDYLMASDYFISASLAEGLPNTVLEAMAAKLPCILSDISPHLEIAELGRNPPLIFETKDIEGLRDKIKNIVNLDYESMSLSSRHVIEQYLNASNMSKCYQGKYLELL